MATQKHENNCWEKFFAFVKAYKPKAELIKIHNSVDSCRPYGRLLENQKTVGNSDVNI